MSENNFQIHLDMAAQGARLLGMVDAVGYLNAIERAHAIGPFVDPTGYRNAIFDPGVGNAEALLRAVRDFQEAVRKQVPDYATNPLPLYSRTDNEASP